MGQLYLIAMFLFWLGWVANFIGQMLMEGFPRNSSFCLWGDDCHLLTLYFFLKEVPWCESVNVSMLFMISWQR
jgi:hypothetical protein